MLRLATEGRMKNLMLSIVTLWIGVSHSFAKPNNAPLIEIDTPWKKAVTDFANQHLAHSAWGVAHSKRDYLLSLELAEKDGLKVDTEILFAAAFLHDMGGFDEFKKPDVDHAVRSAELVEDLIKPMGFPVEKIPALKGVILAHTYYNPNPPVTPEEIVFHDADVLDFLGEIGIARIVSLTERDPVAKTLSGAVQVATKLQHDLSSRLAGTYSKHLGEQRFQEAHKFLTLLDAESYGGEAL
jgi:uncharacterized protein